MDPNRRPTVQVVINGNGHGQAQVHGSTERRTRPLAVDEALQYSPMSSSPVFGLGMSGLIVLCCLVTTTVADSSFSSLLLDCILRPDVGRPSNTTSINHILQAGRSALNQLNSDFESGCDESNRFDTSREYIQQLLDPDQLTEL